MSNPYGLMNLWAQGDTVIRIVALILLVMSVLSWFVILTKGWQALRLRQKAQVADERFWHCRSFEEGMRLLAPGRAGNPFCALAEDGVNAVTHHAHNQEDLHGALNINDWLNSCLRRSIENINARLQSGLSVLASIGSTAPFVGLFGTVWGIYHALVGIGVSGQASIDKVAGPVGEALIMTAFGLAVAIPAVLGYNALMRGNKAILAKLNNFAHDLHAFLLTGRRVGQDTATAPLRVAAGAGA